MPEKRTPPYFKIFVTAMIVTVIFGGVFVWTLSSKTSGFATMSNPSYSITYRYIGLGFSKEENLLGKIPVELKVPLWQEFGDYSLYDDRLVIHLRNERVDDNPDLRKCTFEYVDAAGNRRAEGVGVVEYSGLDCVRPHLYKIDEATYFKADGTVGSKIIGGNGKETWWNGDASLFLESIYENGYWTNTTFYDENGNVKEYVDEEGWKCPEE